MVFNTISPDRTSYRHTGDHHALSNEPLLPFHENHHDGRYSSVKRRSYSQSNILPHTKQIGRSIASSSKENLYRMQKSAARTFQKIKWATHFSKRPDILEIEQSLKQLLKNGDKSDKMQHHLIRVFRSTLKNADIDLPHLKQTTHDIKYDIEKRGFNDHTIYRSKLTRAAGLDNIQYGFVTHFDSSNSVNFKIVSENSSCASTSAVRNASQRFIQNYGKYIPDVKRNQATEIFISSDQINPLNEHKGKNAFIHNAYGNNSTIWVNASHDASSLEHIATGAIIEALSHKNYYIGLPSHASFSTSKKGVQEWLETQICSSIEAKKSYSPQFEAVQTAIEDKKITSETLYKAYFSGDYQSIKIVRAALEKTTQAWSVKDVEYLLKILRSNSQSSDQVQFANNLRLLRSAIYSLGNEAPKTFKTEVNRIISLKLTDYINSSEYIRKVHIDLIDAAEKDHLSYNRFNPEYRIKNKKQPINIILERDKFNRKSKVFDAYHSIISFANTYIDDNSAKRKISLSIDESAGRVLIFGKMQNCYGKCTYHRNTDTSSISIRENLEKNLFRTTIIHELFHALAHISQYSPLYNQAIHEGVTEYLTRRVMSYQSNYKGSYEEQVQNIHQKINSGEISENTLMQYYFTDNIHAKNQVLKALIGIPAMTIQKQEP